MAGTQTDNIQILDADGTIRGLEGSDDLVVSASLRVNNNVVIDGSLTAKKVTSIETEELRVADNHILLNDGYTVNAAQTAGLLANYFPTALQTTVAAGGFTAGIAATSDPTINVAASTFAANDIILVTGSADENNNGLYEVLTDAAGLITVRGIGLNATVEDWSNDQFVTDTTIAGTVTKVTISVWRAGIDGIWESANGSNHGGAGFTYTDVTMGGTATLQTAYDNDVDGSNVLITTNGTDGALIVAGTEKLQVTATGGLDVDTVADFDVSNFDVLSSGPISLDADTASNLSVTTGNLTLSTITSGTLFVTSAGLLDIDAAANMDVDVTGTYDLLATGAGSLDFTGASNVTADSGNLTLSTTTSGDVNVTAAGDIDADATNVTIDATAGFSIDGATSSNVTASGSSAGGIVLTLSAANAGAGVGDVHITADDEIDITAPTQVNVQAGVWEAVLTSNYTLDASGLISLDGVGNSNFTTDTGNLTLSTTTSGGVNITSAGDSTLTVPNASTTAWTLTDGTDTYAVVNSVTNCLELQSCVVFTAPPAIQLVTDVTLSEGDLVYIKANGNVALADADAGTLREGSAVAASTGAYVATNTAALNSFHGSLVPVRFAATPAAADNGKEVFLSTTAGQATLTAPTGTGTVTYFLGYLQGGDGADATPEVLWAPNFRSRHPSVTVP